MCGSLGCENSFKCHDFGRVTPLLGEEDNSSFACSQEC